MSNEPDTMPQTPEALTKLVDRILARTGLTKELALGTPLPTLLAISLLLDEVDALQEELCRPRTVRPLSP